MQTYKVIGTMSGTSLDGLDIVYCTFKNVENQWEYAIEQGKTVQFSDELRKRLATVENGSALELAQLNVDFGHFIGQEVHNFVQSSGFEPEFVASHGHTIFHQPEKKLTLQIGDGAAIAAECKLPVICDFRSLDVAMGGQGAPLVPIGDRLLFGKYDYCLNLGGIANISYEKNGERIAFDICPINMAMNPITQKYGEPYDEDGNVARSGEVNQALLADLNALAFYQQNPPKSLGKEWYLSEFLPVIEKHDPTAPDALRTICEHAAEQIVKVTGNKTKQRILVTGGGAFNKFFVESLERLAPKQFKVGTPELIDFKEALIFAFLGVRRSREESNCLSSVTGASGNNVGGSIYHA